jgi:23S rRNA (guanosine2251-2'-O)-methyltransferase
MKTEILYGIHPVAEALKAARRNFYEICIVQGKVSNRLEHVIKSAQASHVQVKRLTRAQLAVMTGTDMHQGIGARVDQYPFADFSDIYNPQGKIEADPFILLLDHVVDTRNLGAIIRTALCVGVDGIVIPKDRSASPTPGVSKASAGALEHVLLAKVTNMVDTIRHLKEKDIWVVGMDKSADLSVFSSELSGPIAIVIGGEEKGLRPLVKKHCDYLVSIPQAGDVNSLNASVAGAVVMYEVIRQRMA